MSLLPDTLLTFWFESENYRFRLDGQWKAGSGDARGIAAFAREMEAVWGFRLVSAKRKRDGEKVFRNPDRTPLPADGNNLGHVSLSWPMGGLVTILINGRFTNERRDALAVILDQYFDRPEMTAPWSRAMDVVCSSWGEHAVRNYRKTQRHVANRALPRRVEAADARERFLALVKESFAKAGVELGGPVSLPCDSETVADLHHPAANAFFAFVEEADSADPESFDHERRIDRRLQMAGHRIFRFASSEFADAGKARETIDAFRDRYRSHLVEGRPWSLPVRVDLASRGRVANLKLEYDLTDAVKADPEAFARRTEELLGWRVIRIAEPGPDGLARFAWRHPEPHGGPEDEVQGMLWIAHGRARSALTFVPFNRDKADSDEVVAWLTACFRPMGSNGFLNAKCISVKRNYEFRRGDALHRKLQTRREGYDSRYEVLLHGALKRAGLSPELQRVVYDREQILTILDFCFPAERVAVMADGHACHSSPAAVIRDRVQDRMLQLLGFVVLRYSNTLLDLELDACVSQIGEAVKSRRGAATPGVES